MRSKFDQQLALLNEELTQMGETCAKAICLAAQALEAQDAATAAPVAELEEQTNEQERSIEALCLKLLLQQQPVARDLRQISAALKMITDMERIGDQAADIAEIIPFFLSHNTFDCTLVCRMAQQAPEIIFLNLQIERFILQRWIRWRRSHRRLFRPRFQIQCQTDCCRLPWKRGKRC